MSIARYVDSLSEAAAVNSAINTRQNYTSEAHIQSSRFMIICTAAGAGSRE